MVILLLCSILIGIFGGCAFGFAGNDCLIERRKKAGICYIVSGAVGVLICGLGIGGYIGYKSQPVVEIPPTAAEICDAAAVSPILCETISEYTGEDDVSVAYYLSYCAKGGEDLNVAIDNMNLGLSETEISAIITFSDKRQAEAAELEENNN